jgi:hypothetical protein
MSLWKKFLNWINSILHPTTTTTTTGTDTTTTSTVTSPPSDKLLTAFLLPGQEGSKYTNAQGRTCTLSAANDNDRESMNKQRLYLVDYLKSIKANVFPMIVANDDSNKDNYINPFKSGWGGTINGDFLAWMYFSNNDVKMLGHMCSDRGMSQIPILFCSENNGGPFTNPSWAEQMIKDLRLFFITNGNVKWICTHLEAEKFVTPNEVNRIAGFVRKYMPEVKICVHATNTSFAKCDVDAVCVQAPWHPRDGDLHSPEEVVNDLKRYLSAGAKRIIAGEYNWNSENSKAKAQGQAALKMPECLGAWCGW